MKKLLSFVLCLSVLLILLSGCGMFGTKHITDVNKYGKTYSNVDFPEFFPETVNEYTVNAYSYTVYSYLDVCYEIFLDVTVSEEQFDILIDNVKNYSDSFQEGEAYYAKGYYEIIFTNEYSLGFDENPQKESPNVWNAKIEKVIYNPDTYNIVFESFDAFDSGVYPLNEVAYFNRFKIDEVEYKQSLDD